jgi:hypothetical protein
MSSASKTIKQVLKNILNIQQSLLPELQSYIYPEITNAAPTFVPFPPHTQRYTGIGGKTEALCQGNMAQSGKLSATHFSTKSTSITNGTCNLVQCANSTCLPSKFH